AASIRAVALSNRGWRVHHDALWRLQHKEGDEPMRRGKVFGNQATVWPYLFALPFVLAYAVFQLFPVGYSFFLSLHEWNGIGEKTFIGLQNYVDLFTRDPLFYKSIFNTVLLMLMSLPVMIILGLLMAYMTFNLLKGKRFFQTVNFLPYITTPVAIGFLFSFLFDWQTGTVNEVLVRLGILSEKYYWLQEPFTAR